MNFGRQVIDFHRELEPNWKIPIEIDLIFPFDNRETLDVFEGFYKKFFSDTNERRFLFGINPGRFGAGITGIPFTDPVVLQDICQISNDFSKRQELSSIFIYQVIESMGGPENFYSQYYITSVCPLGFIRDGKNCNYYDDPVLYKSVEDHIIDNISAQIKFGCNRSIAYSLGQGKNYKYLKILNERYGFFEEILPLPHPRWVMQYKRKHVQNYIGDYHRLLTM